MNRSTYTDDWVFESVFFHKSPQTTLPSVFDFVAGQYYRIARIAADFGTSVGYVRRIVADCIAVDWDAALDAQHIADYIRAVERYYTPLHEVHAEFLILRGQNGDFQTLAVELVACVVDAALVLHGFDIAPQPILYKSTTVRDILRYRLR